MNLRRVPEISFGFHDLNARKALLKILPCVLLSPPPLLVRGGRCSLWRLNSTQTVLPRSGPDSEDIERSDVPRAIENKCWGSWPLWAKHWTQFTQSQICHVRFPYCTAWLSPFFALRNKPNCLWIWLQCLEISLEFVLAVCSPLGFKSTLRVSGFAEVSDLILQG